MGRHVARVSTPEFNFGSAEITSPFTNTIKNDTPNANFLSYQLRIEYDTINFSSYLHRDRVKIWSYRNEYVFQRADLRILLKGYNPAYPMRGKAAMGS
jgi:hypothetical protein